MISTQPPRQILGRLMGEAGEDHLVEQLGLLLDRRDDRADGDGHG